MSTKLLVSYVSSGNYLYSCLSVCGNKSVLAIHSVYLWKEIENGDHIERGLSTTI